MTENTKKAIKKPLYKIMDGIIYPAPFSTKCYREVLDYKAQPDDIFLATYPKSGTLWMHNVAFYIFRKGKELENMSEFLKYCPFIDMLGKEGIDKMPRPGIFKTHLPFQKLPYSPKAKYIFVTRNPKDCVVSFYHFTKNQPGFGFWDGEFDDFFELFMAGEVECNDYFDHLLSWYPHRNDSNVFYTTYEEMKRDIRSLIVKLATFLGKEYIDAIENDNSVLNNIVYYSSFDYMKKHLSGVYEFRPKEGQKIPDVFHYEGISHIKNFLSQLELPSDLPERNFVRKGIVGDWKNVLTLEQNERLNEKFKERTKGTEIPQWFSMS